jgi:AAA15 family ATPase/GTPase
MLIEFTIQNYASFNTSQTLSMLASSSTKENFNETNIIPVNKFGIDNLLKSATIFGANSSGKSNLVKALYIFRNIILESLNKANSDNLSGVVPFLIKDEIYDIPSEFEIVFIVDSNIYRYGISISEQKILEEWLYWTKTSRETLLFHRNGQQIKINQRSFKEAKDFIKKTQDNYIVEKTREDVPFISVLSNFNGEKSRKIINWFHQIKIVSGIQEQGFKGFTLELLDKNKDFKNWALKILSSLQIYDIKIVEEFDDISINVVKKIGNSTKEHELPLKLESDGTKKLLYLLGPIFEVIKSSQILIIDEFDNKFHSLLSKYILKLYHQKNDSGSQLITTCHDTNLLTKELLRRDQIWFVEKNNNHESELYSLLEYKEHYTRIGDSYSKDYLDGRYGAIPLFSSIDELMDALNG